MKKTNYTLHLLPAILLVIGAIATFFASQIAENYLDLLGMLLIVGLASMLLGALMGFLFGIPKSNASFNLKNHNEQRYLPRTVTNLEEISNWLSIMVVGLILVNAAKFPFYLESVSNSILANNDCHYNCQFAQAIIIGEILFSSISGFIIAYAYTRFFYISHISNVISKEKNSDFETWKDELRKGSSETYKPSPLQTESKSSGRSSKLSNYLTEDELNILKMIFEEDNNFVVRKPLTYKENAIVNELVEKGIVKEIEGGSFRTGATLSIADKSLIEALK